MRKYTVPLKKGTSKATVSQNISEFHTGPTYAHTKAKFGKARADAQAVAAAMSQKRRSARKMARGGKVKGGVKGKDSVHILATPGETVMNTGATKLAGDKRLALLNEAGRRLEANNRPYPQSERSDLAHEAEESFYGGGQAPTKPTPTPTPKPRRMQGGGLVERFAQRNPATAALARGAGKAIVGAARNFMNPGSGLPKALGVEAAKMAITEPTSETRRMKRGGKVKRMQLGGPVSSPRSVPTARAPAVAPNPMRLKRGGKVKRMQFGGPVQPGVAPAGGTPGYSYATATGHVDVAPRKAGERLPGDSRPPGSATSLGSPVAAASRPPTSSPLDKFSTIDKAPPLSQQPAFRPMKRGGKVKKSPLDQIVNFRG